MDKYRHKNALLIDDNHIDSLINSKILRKCNYAEDVTINNSASGALELIRNSVHSGLNVPDVIFLDVRMPQMNGLDFLVQLGMIEGIENHDLKIYALSSSLDPKEIAQMKGHKAITKFICKPLSQQLLSEI